MRDEIKVFFFFFFNDTATPEFYTLPLHDALPIYESRRHESAEPEVDGCSFHCFSSALGAQHERGEHEVEGEDHERGGHHRARRRSGDAFRGRDRKSTRLNSSHSQISYAVFCLKKK